MSDTINDVAVPETEALPDYEAPPETMAPEAVAEAAPEPERPAEKHVPLAALMREREQAKAAREELARFRQEAEAQNRRFEQMMQHFQTQLAPPKPAEPMPDINVDPVGYLQRQNAELAREIAEMKAFKQQFDQQGQQLTQEQQFYQTLHAQAEQYRAEAPDLDDAVKFLADALKRDYATVGMTPDQAAAQLREQERLIASNALRQGRNPAEALYALAKARGYASKSADPAAKIEAMQRGQAAARSTAAPGARGRFDGLSVDALAKMSAADIAKIPDSEFRRLMGG